MRLLTDSCIYKQVLESPDGPLVSFLAVHIDDSIVLTTPSHTEDVIDELLHKFNMRGLGELNILSASPSSETVAPVP